MWFEQHPYISIYLIGCVIAVTLHFFRIALFWSIGWITGGNILAKNLEKLQKPDKESIVLKAMRQPRKPLQSFDKYLEELKKPDKQHAAAVKKRQFEERITIVAVFSWISVAIIILLIFEGIFIALREALKEVPDEIKALRFPLRNNLMLSRESVWAYCYALLIKSGVKRPSESDIQSSLDELARYHDNLDRKAALEQLRNLNVVNDDVITEIQKYYEDNNE